MRHKIIKRVFTRIRRKRQLVGLEVADYDKIIYLTFSQIRQALDIESSHLELLVDSTVRPVFYMKGEIMFDGRPCETDGFVIKDFWITLSDTIENLPEKHKGLLIPFHKIRDIRAFTRNNLENLCIKVHDSEKVFFLSTSRVTSFTGLDKSELHVLKDSFIWVEYYKKDEIMYGGKICYEDDKIVKSFLIRFSGNIDQMHQNFEESCYYLAEEDDSDSIDYKEAEDLTFRYAYEGDWNNAWNTD